MKNEKIKMKNTIMGLGFINDKLPHKVDNYFSLFIFHFSLKPTFHFSL